MRLILQYTKLGAMGYVAHLDFQRLWQRLFRIAGIEVQMTQGYNPHPRIRFAVPLATGFQSTSELLEVHLAAEMKEGEVIQALNCVTPQGLDVLAAIRVSDQFPKVTALVDALQYQVLLPKDILDSASLCVSGTIATKSGEISVSEYLLSAVKQADNLLLLIKVNNQRTLRPDLVVQSYFPNLSSGQYSITRTGIFARDDSKISPVPTGLSILFD